MLQKEGWGGIRELIPDIKKGVLLLSKHFK